MPHHGPTTEPALVPAIRWGSFSRHAAAITPAADLDAQFEKGPHAQRRRARRREKVSPHVDVRVPPGGIEDRLNQLLCRCRANTAFGHWVRHGHRKKQAGQAPVDFARSYFTTKVESGGRLTQDKVTRSIREHSGVACSPKLDDQSGCIDPPSPSFRDGLAVGPSVAWADEIYPMNWALVRYSPLPFGWLV